MKREDTFLVGHPLKLAKFCAEHYIAQNRYLAALNHPLLQNKLPEHIRSRALFYKDVLLEVAEYRDKEYVMSIE